MLSYNGIILSRILVTQLLPGEIMLSYNGIILSRILVTRQAIGGFSGLMDRFI
jgi:hypothetical protein